MPNKLSVVVGGQFGSEGKGAITGYLASAEQNPDHRTVVVRVAGPNAGHTVLGKCPPFCPQFDVHSPDTLGWAETNGTPVPGNMKNAFGWAHPWRLRQVPVGAVTNPAADLVIAAGSEIDPQVLLSEITELDSAGYRVSDRLIIDRSATVIEPRHLQNEAEWGFTDRMGSTGKGIGAARMERVARTASTWAGHNDASPQGLATTDTSVLLNRWLAVGQDGQTAGQTHVLVEGTQGYGLGVHTRWYPQSTSSDCRAVDFLAMAGICPWVMDSQPEIWVVLRTHPIRVAGNSGALSGETSWDELGVRAERTTVTNKVRRVGAWDPLLAREAVEANGGIRSDSVFAPPVYVALTMADYIVPGLAHHDNGSYDGVSAPDRTALFDLLTEVTSDCGVFPTLIGTGPATLLDLRPAGPEGPPSIAGLSASVQRRVQATHGNGMARGVA